MHNTYAPGSHDWFVPNTLLHLNTNLFNYISLFYTYLFTYLHCIAYCLCQAYAWLDAFGLAWMHSVLPGCIRRPRPWSGWAEGPWGGGAPQRGPGPGGEPPRAGRRMHRPPNAFGGRMHSAAECIQRQYAFGGSMHPGRRMHPNRAIGNRAIRNRQ